MAQRWRCFATTAAGLEPFLARELLGLKAARVERRHTGVEFEGNRVMVEKACLTLRTAHRVLWRVADLDASHPDRLYATARKHVRWQGLIPPDRTFCIRATASNSVFRDARFAGLRLKDAIVDSVRDAVGERPSVDTDYPDITVRLGVKGRSGVVSLDAAGDSLHMRGYRQASGPAPLRETLAAAAVLASGWDGTTPLVDPMCGAGTIPIEAAWIGRRIAPGLARRDFCFQRWPGHRVPRYQEMVASLRAQARPGLDVPILGFDRDRRALDAAKANARRAGVDIQWAARDLERGLESDALPPEPGVVVTNPPYGARLGDERSALRTYEALGQRLRDAFADWTVCVFAHTREQVEALGLPVERYWHFKNGALDVTLIRAQL